jgi:ribosomal protein S27AE
MGRLKIDGCPKCGRGVIALDKDEYGWYEYCLQCGYTHDLVAMTEPATRLAVKSQPPGVELSGEEDSPPW